MSDVAEVVTAGVVGYVLGTFPSATVVTRLATRGRIDIRRSGSGNPGGLNAMQVVGKRWGLLVIVLDALKGAIAGLVGMALAGDAGAYTAATAAVAGHCFPVWSRFAGGKGVATAGGSFVTVFPPMFLIGGVTAGVASVVTRRSEPAMWITSVVWLAGAIAWTVAGFSNWWGPEPGAGMVAYAAVGAAIVLGRFRAAARAKPPAMDPDPAAQ